MKVNFEVTDNYALNFDGRHIDIHNNFIFVGYAYNVAERELKLTWTKSSGGWVGKDELSGLVLIHKTVTYLTITNQDEKSNFEDDSCLGEVSFFPSSAREINDSILPQSKPKDGDDILYFFENGQSIRIHCEQILITVN